MNLRLALLLAKRLLGCRVVGHEFFYWSEPGEALTSVDHRVCEIAACQLHQTWNMGRWVETRVGAPGL